MKCYIDNGFCVHSNVITGQNKDVVEMYSIIYCMEMCAYVESTLDRHTRRYNTSKTFLCFCFAAWSNACVFWYFNQDNVIKCFFLQNFNSDEQDDGN